MKNSSLILQNKKQKGGENIMARAKRSSIELDKSHKLLNALTAIDGKLDLGNNLTLVKLNESVSALELKLKTYNDMLSAVDLKKEDLENAEKDQHDLLKRFVDGVKSKYGTESDAYATIGGTRPSDRKTPQKNKPNNKTS